jgi:hypothetical protein
MQNCSVNKTTEMDTTLQLTLEQLNKLSADQKRMDNISATSACQDELKTASTGLKSGISAISLELKSDICTVNSELKTNISAVWAD